MSGVKKLREIKKALAQGKIVEVSFNKKYAPKIIINHPKIKTAKEFFEKILDSQSELLTKDEFQTLVENISKYSIMLPLLHIPLTLGKAKTFKRFLPFVTDNDEAIIDIFNYAYGWRPEAMAFLFPENAENLQRMIKNGGEIELPEQFKQMTVTKFVKLLEAKIAERINIDASFVVNGDEVIKHVINEIKHCNKFSDRLLQYLEPEVLNKLDEKERDSFNIFLIYLYLTTEEEKYAVGGNAIKAIEHDRQIREANMGKEITLLGSLQLKEQIKYTLVNERGLSLQELQALFDVVLRLNRIKQTDLVTIAKTEKQAQLIQSSIKEELIVITPKLIQKLLGVNEKTAWRIKNSIENLNGKKIVAELDQPIELPGSGQLKSFAITPLIEHPRSPIEVKYGKQTLKVRIFRIDPLLTRVESFVQLPANPITRILDIQVPNNVQQFITDVYFYLLCHRHNNIAHINPVAFSRSFPNAWAKTRHTSVLREKINSALKHLQDVGLIDDYKEKHDGWEVELR